MPTNPIVLAGELDASNAAALREALNTSTGPVTVDMGAVTFIDSTILDVLARAATQRAVTVASPCRHIRRVLHISGIDQLVTVE